MSQTLNSFTNPSPSKHKKHKPPQDPAVPPDLTIPVTPLGFAPPAPYYLGDRIAQVSLDFLNEDTLLFTFRIPGLIPRASTTNAEPQTVPDLTTAAREAEQNSRNIRALVLALPSGRVKAEAIWRLHDYQPYLWMLKDGRFLLRDRNSVQLGDADLRLTPFLRFPGYVRQLGLDPAEHLLVTNSYELLAPDSSVAPQRDDPPSKSGSESEPRPGESGLPATAAASIATFGHPTPDPAPTAKPANPGQNLLRILSMDDRSVLLFSRVTAPVRLPLDGEGYYEALRGSGTNWQIMYTHFSGASAPLLQIESTCNPALEVQAPGILLISGCTPAGVRRLTAIDRNWEQNKTRIWESFAPPTGVWPLLVHASSGTRMARATLDVNHPVTLTSPLDSSDIHSQTVQVYDLATGKVALTLQLSPILDAGGNFALSPSGNRFAILNAGSIQIYDLPPAPAMPPTSPLIPVPARR